MDDFAVVMFEELQQYRVLRFELLTSLSNEVMNCGDWVNARESNNSSDERAQLLHRGTMGDCDVEYAKLVNQQIKAIPTQLLSKKIIDRMSKNKIAQLYSDQKQNNDKLSENFDQLYLKLNQMKKVILEKDQQIAMLESKVDELQELNEALNVNEPTHSDSSQVKCNSCQQFGLDIAELKTNIALLIEDRNATSSSNQFGLVKLSTNSKLCVSHARFHHARLAKSPTSFAQRLVTAVFKYDEIIGATVSGKSTSSAKQKTKKLCANRVADMIESAISHYPDHPSANVTVIRISIGWKVTNLNNGVSALCDFEDWEGFEEKHFESLKSSNSSTSNDHIDTSKSPIDEDNSNSMNIFKAMTN